MGEGSACASVQNIGERGGGTTHKPSWTLCVRVCVCVCVCVCVSGLRAALLHCDLVSWNPRQHDSTKGKQNVLENNGALSCSSQHMLYSPGPKPESKTDGLRRHSSWSICAGNRSAFFRFVCCLFALLRATLCVSSSPK